MENSIFIYDFIGESLFESGVTDKSFRDELAKFSKSDPLTVHVNSPGGSVSHGVAIYTMLEQWEGPVTVQIDGQAASIASYIAMAGNEIKIADGGWIMVHNPSTIVAGGSSEMRKAADVLDKMGDRLAKKYSDRTGKPMAEIKAMMDEETWLMADESIAHGFADSLTGEAVAAIAIPEIFGFKHPPNPAAAAVQRAVNSLAARQRQLDLTRARFAG